MINRMYTSLGRKIRVAVETLWRLCFRFWGLFKTTTVASATFGGERVWVIAPHPDDETIGCGSAMWMHRNHNDPVRVTVVTDGGAMQRSGLKSDDVAGLRNAESRRALKILGVQGEWLGEPENHWEFNEVVAQFKARLMSDRPSLIYAPSRIDYHPEHHKVAHALAMALTHSPHTGLRVRCYQVQVPLTRHLVNIEVEGSASEEKVRRAFAVYASQTGSIRAATRLGRYVAAARGDCSRREQFWELTASQFIKLHCDPPSTDWVHHYFGLRYFPWLDPWAFMKGRSRRKQLATLVATSGKHGT